MSHGSQFCTICGGRGIRITVHGRHKCICVTGTKEQREATSRMQSPDGKTTASQAVAALFERERNK